MNRIFITIATLLIFETLTFGQSIMFRSSKFEAGIRQHMGLGTEDAVTSTMLDTITKVDLSGLGITTIQDVELLPNIQWIDLSHNEIEDIAPLSLLDSLRFVNLSHNMLESISMLTFSQAEEMSVDVSFNYISDFSCFNTITPCIFSIAGAGLQQDKNAPFFDVYQLYADVNDDGTTKACWRGYTNMEADIKLKCSSLNVPASMDGYTNSVALPNALSSTARVILTNGEVGDTTYVVPPKHYPVQGGGEVTVDTNLPESYQIGYLRALYGTVKAEGTTLHYTAPSPVVADTLYMSYFEGSRIKGFAQMYFVSQDIYDDVKNIKQDNPLKMSLHDGMLSIACLPTQQKGITAVKVYDAMGRTLALQTFDNQQNVVVKLPSSPGIVIVEVTYAGQHVVTKVSAK